MDPPQKKPRLETEKEVEEPPQNECTPGPANNREGQQQQVNTGTVREGLDPEPLPVGSFERLMNNQVWEDVLGYLKDPIDIFNTSQTCSTFHDMMEVNMLTGVLKLVHDRKYLRLSNDKRLMRGNKNVLNLRLVSKAWKQAADNAFMDSFNSKDWHTNLNTFSDIRMYELTSAERMHPAIAFFGNPADIDRAMSILKTSGSPGSLVSIICVNENKCPEGEMDLLYSKISDFLNQYRHLVHGLYYISSCTKENKSVDKYQNLLNLVKQLPFLKALKLRAYSCQGAAVITRKLDQNYVDLHPFPTMPHLELVEFDLQMCYEEQSSFTVELVKKCPSVKRIILMDNMFRVCNENVASALLNSANLESFEMDCYSDSLMKALITKPLRTLRVKRGCTVKPAILFPLISQLGATLEHLVISLDDLTIPTDLQLELPRLKRLRITGNIITNTLNFIQPLRSLERLYISEISMRKKDATPSELDSLWDVQLSVLKDFFPSLRSHKIVRRQDNRHRRYGAWLVF